MLGENIDSAGYPNCGEIDIMEMAGSTEGVENATCLKYSRSGIIYAIPSSKA